MHSIRPKTSVQIKCVAFILCGASKLLFNFAGWIKPFSPQRAERLDLIALNWLLRGRRLEMGGAAVKLPPDITAAPWPPRVTVRWRVCKRCRRHEVHETVKGQPLHMQCVLCDLADEREAFRQERQTYTATMPTTEAAR